MGMLWGYVGYNACPYTCLQGSLSGVWRSEPSLDGEITPRPRDSFNGALFKPITQELAEKRSIRRG
jgi:hypothetical protein